MPSVNPNSFVLDRARAQIKKKHGYEELRHKKQHKKTHIHKIHTEILCVQLGTLSLCVLILAVFWGQEAVYVPTQHEVHVCRKGSHL